MIVPNGLITGVRVIPTGCGATASRSSRATPRALRASVQEVVGAVAGAGEPWDAPARIVCRPLADGLTRVIAVVEVGAGREAAREDWLSRGVAARRGAPLGRSAARRGGGRAEPPAPPSATPG
jgi:hypothetical protein